MKYSFESKSKILSGKNALASIPFELSYRNVSRPLIIAEDEITTQPYAEYQVLDKSFRTKWFDKDIAVDVVGMIPKGAKKTDVKISVEPNKYQEPTAQTQFENLDIIKEFESSISTGLTTKSPELWYPVTKAKFRQIKKVLNKNRNSQNVERVNYLNEQIDYVSKKWDAELQKDYAKVIDLERNKPIPKSPNKDYFKQSKVDTQNNLIFNLSDKFTGKTQNAESIDQLIQKTDALEKYLDKRVRFDLIGRKKITARGRGGNPFTANAFMPDTKQSRQSGFTKPTQATTAERETPRAFTETRKTQSTGTPKSKSSFESVFSKSSPKTTKTSERKAATTGTGVFGLGSSSPIFTSSKSGPSRVTETFSSGIQRTPNRSESSIGRSTSRGTRAKSGSSKTSSSSSSGPKIFDTPMKRKTPKLRWDKNKDRRKKSYYNVFTVENVDLPILRGEEALTGQTLPKQELPANKKTVYQFGNIFTTKKPREYRKTNKKGFRI